MEFFAKQLPDDCCFAKNSMIPWVAVYIPWIKYIYVSDIYLFISIITYIYIYIYIYLEREREREMLNCILGKNQCFYSRKTCAYISVKTFCKSKKENKGTLLKKIKKIRGDKSYPSKKRRKKRGCGLENGKRGKMSKRSFYIDCQFIFTVTSFISTPDF